MVKPVHSVKMKKSKQMDMLGYDSMLKAMQKHSKCACQTQYHSARRQNLF
jgi:hypothetical protein